LGYDFYVIKKESDPKCDITKAPADGCYVYGLFLDGCRWDDEEMALAEPLPKILNYSMSYIWLIPTVQDQIDKTKHVRDPLYSKTKSFILGIHLPGLQNFEKSRNFVNYRTQYKLRLEHESPHVQEAYSKPLD